MLHAFRIPASLLLIGSASLAFVGPAQAQPVVPASNEIPKAPDVDDPMLAPVAPPKRYVASWADALNLVHARSTDLATAYAEIRRAEAATRSALAATLPTVNASASIPHQFITREVTTVNGTTQKIPNGDYLNANISLGQTLVNVQQWYAIKTGKENEKAASLSAEDVNRTVVRGMATAILAVVVSERVADLNRIGLQSALQRRELTVRKQKLGVATGLDVVRADQDVAAARTLLVTGDESLRKAREALGLALGLPEQIGVPKEMKIDEVTKSAAMSCPPVESLVDRPDIAALRKRIEVADRGVKNVELSFLPTLTATSNLGTTTQDTGASPTTTWNVQAVLTIPIWDGGARYGALRTARVNRDEASFALEAATRGATIEVVQARRNVVVSEQTLAVAKQTRDLAAQVDQLTQTAYRAGQGTSLELIIAAAALRSAEIDLALREFDVVKSRLDALFTLSKCTDAR